MFSNQTDSEENSISKLSRTWLTQRTEPDEEEAREKGLPADVILKSFQGDEPAKADGDPEEVGEEAAFVQDPEQQEPEGETMASETVEDKQESKTVEIFESAPAPELPEPFETTAEYDDASVEELGRELSRVVVSMIKTFDKQRSSEVDSKLDAMRVEMQAINERLDSQSNSLLKLGQADDRRRELLRQLGEVSPEARNAS